jgi:hypothetical protein
LVTHRGAVLCALLTRSAGFRPPASHVERVTQRLPDLQNRFVRVLPQAAELLMAPGRIRLVDALPPMGHIPGIRPEPNILIPAPPARWRNTARTHRIIDQFYRVNLKDGTRKSAIPYWSSRSLLACSALWLAEPVRCLCTEDQVNRPQLPGKHRRTSARRTLYTSANHPPPPAPIV